MKVITYTSRLKEADLMALVLRLALGTVFILHGAQKHFGWFHGAGWAATIQFMTHTVGVPKWMGALAIFAEFYGGISVLIGIFARFGALGIAIDMTVAILKVHWHNGFFESDKGFEYPFALLAMALALILYGAGRWSLDALFTSERKQRSPAK